MDFGIIYAIVGALCIYCFAYTVYGFFREGGLCGCGTVIIKAKGDCDGLERAVMCASDTGGSIIILDCGTSEEGALLCEKISSVKPLVYYIKSADGIMEIL